MNCLIRIGLTGLILSLSLIVCSCGDSTTSQKVSSRVKDHEAFALGENHAARLIQIADDESAVQEYLLDVKARATNISEKIGAQSAADYERGFKKYIETNCDSIAKILF